MIRQLHGELSSFQCDAAVMFLPICLEPSNPDQNFTPKRWSASWIIVGDRKHSKGISRIYDWGT